MSFYKNCWYPVGWSSELSDSPIGKVILNENIVIFREFNGNIAALEDRCPHRFLPLSAGKVTKKGLQCGYHGLTFGETGDCTASPTQAELPTGACVKSYPVAENLGLVWIWMGNPKKANTKKIFNLPEYHDPKWAVGYGDALTIDANYLLLCDNLCDPTHVNYVHPTTLGNPNEINAPVTYKPEKWGVTTTRWTRNSEPVGFFKVFGNYGGVVDRWQIYHMHVPSTAIIDFGSIVAGKNQNADNDNGHIQVLSCHFICPVTENSSIDYWLHARNFETDNSLVGEQISEQFRIAFKEDKTILSMIQKEEEKIDNQKKLGLDLDASAGLFRHMVDQKIKEELTTV